MDLHQTRRACRRNAVHGRLVHRVEDGVVDAFELQRGACVPTVADANGWLHGWVSPGLRLAVGALRRDDLPALHAAIERSFGPPAHRALVARLTPAG